MSNVFNVLRANMEKGRAFSNQPIKTSSNVNNGNLEDQIYFVERHPAHTNNQANLQQESLGGDLNNNEQTAPSHAQDPHVPTEPQVVEQEALSEQEVKSRDELRARQEELNR